MQMTYEDGMNIVQFESSMAADLARCYNTVIAPVPHCRPVSPETFATTERLACSACREEALLVARETDGEIRIRPCWRGHATEQTRGVNND